MFKLRDYQQKCIDSIIAEARKGVVRQIMVLATGLGKTVIFGHLPSKVRDKGKKTLILAHREELLDQAKDKIEQIDPTLRIEIEQGARNIEDVNNVDVVIASVPTLGRAGSERIKKFNPDDFGLIICDEAHHATSSTYLNIFRYFDVLKGEVSVPNGRVLLGCTATPTRADKVGLDKVFDKIVFNYTLQQGIDSGYLSNIEAYTVQTKTDISQVHTRMGDFAEGELAEEVNNAERNNLIVDSYRDIANHSKALVFAVNVDHVIALTRCFRSAGYRASYVIGTTDKSERKQALKDFKDGKIEVLLGVGVFTEGFDEPSIKTILMARPTKSSVLYMQAIGRGTRLFEGKPHVKLIDFVDNTGKNSIVGLPTLFGLSRSLKTKGKYITEVVDKAEKILEVNPDYKLEDIDDWSDLNIDKIIKRVDIFAQAELPAIVKSSSRYAWHKHLEGYQIEFPVKEKIKEMITIQPNMLNRYEVIQGIFTEVKPEYGTGYSKWRKDKVEILGVHNTLFDAFKQGDQWISNNKHEFKTMMSQSAKWREGEPTEKQLALLKKFRIPAPKGLSKGQASTLIGKYLTSRKK
jgi:ATP-dependent helicase IRC3